MTPCRNPECGNVLNIGCHMSAGYCSWDCYGQCTNLVPVNRKSKIMKNFKKLVRFVLYACGVLFVGSLVHHCVPCATTAFVAGSFAVSWGLLVGLGVLLLATWAYGKGR